MKNFMRFVCLCFITLFAVSNLHSQNYWKGGTPGNETDWNTAKNWSKNHIPDWTEDVIIPDVSTQSGYFPVITQTVDVIPHLEIQGNARLTIVPNGELIINGETTINCGIYLIGQLISKGSLVIINTAFEKIDQQGGELLIENKNFVKN